MQRAASFDALRREVIGADALITTPFGERLMVYADYTASGRCLDSIEQYIQQLQRIYANTHTEDDISGRTMSQLLEQAEASIKRSVNAGPDGRIVCVGTGATGAIDKLQQILGVAIPPATQARLSDMLNDWLGDEVASGFREHVRANQPVVFVGPYEHHSNEISWRESLATVVTVDLDSAGGVDLNHLESLLQDPAYDGRVKIGSFSAASNVTGRITPVHQISALLHRYGAIACFDYAASAPYVKIDMNPAPGQYEGDPSLDAIFVSPHKFLGGPGASGVLVFNKRVYQQHLPPTVSAGGTVEYVSLAGQDFYEDIEEREKAGTPGVLQTLKAGLVFQVKDQVGVEAIESREQELLRRALKRCTENSRIEILGIPDPAERIAIVSFNIKSDDGRYLHPKFVTALLNDLFGIQSRAGCSCAGPYGHRLLGIDQESSEQYRLWIRKGYSGIKPGWCRISLHYVMDDMEVDYILDAIEFIAQYGGLFLGLYDFDVRSGGWRHKREDMRLPDFSFDTALHSLKDSVSEIDSNRRRHLYRSFFDEAHRIAKGLGGANDVRRPVLPDGMEDLRFFELPPNYIDGS